MKKTLLLTAVALLIVACNTDNEYHETRILDSSKIVFADQPIDSVVYVTTEVHTISSDASWCKVDDSFQNSINQQIQAHTGIYQLAAYLNFSPNLTGKMRTATVNVNGGDYSAYCLIAQLGNLEVSRPPIAISSELGTDTISTLLLSGLAGTDSISFHTNYPWSLSVPEGSFVTLSKTNGPAGENIVSFSYTANPLTEARTEKITLTSFCSSRGEDTHATIASEGGITTFIPVRQTIAGEAVTQ